MDLTELIGQQVVIDTGTPVVYLGVLEQITQDGFLLSQADVHDTSQGNVSKEYYIIQAKQVGTMASRRRVLVLRATATSISALQDVIER